MSYGPTVVCPMVLLSYMVLESYVLWSYSTGHRQRQNETRSNAFGGQTQTRLRSPRPSNAGNSRALKARFLLEVKLLLIN